jgi:quinol monooxygenase YgiN
VFGLSVRFTCKDEDAARAFDQLVDETLPGIRQREPGTLAYEVHTVEGEPLQRIFYELYQDREAFDAHEEQPHTRRFLAEREQYLASVHVDFLTLRASKRTPGQ